MISHLGSLVQSCWGVGGRAGCCRQMSLCVGSTPRVPATRGLPRSQVCAFPLYTAQAPGCSLWSGPCKLRLVPVFGFSTKVRTRLRLRFVPSPAEQLRQPGACRAHSPRVPRAFSPPGPSLSFPPHQSGACALCLAATLPADVDHPESQEVFG